MLYVDKQADGSTDGEQLFTLVNTYNSEGVTSALPTFREKEERKGEKDGICGICDI